LGNTSDAEVEFGGMFVDLENKLWILEIEDFLFFLKIL